jgi:hypothetical protein
MIVADKWISLQFRIRHPYDIVREITIPAVRCCKGCRASQRVACRSCLTCGSAFCLVSCHPRSVSKLCHFFSKCRESSVGIDPAGMFGDRPSIGRSGGGRRSREHLSGGSTGLGLWDSAPMPDYCRVVQQGRQGIAGRRPAQRADRLKTRSVAVIAIPDMPQIQSEV